MANAVEVLMARWMKPVVATILCAISLAGAAVRVAAWPAADYLVSPQLSSASFIVYTWTVLKEQGWFRGITGRVHYDPAKPQDSSVDIAIQTASLDTNDSGRDTVLRSADFFDVQLYPTMRFVSRHVDRRADGTLAVSGDLTIHGVTKPVDVIATVNGVNNVEHVGRLVGFETTFHIDRTAFGVNGTAWSGGRLLISRDVEVHVAIAATDHPLSTRTRMRP